MKLFKCLVISILFVGMSMIEDSNSHIISRDEAYKMAHLFHKRNNLKMPSLKDPQHFVIQKSALLSLISKIKSFEKNNQNGYLVGRFGCEDAKGNFENLSITLGAYIQNLKGENLPLSSFINISDQPLNKNVDLEKRFQNYIERTNILNTGPIASEKGGFSQIIFSKKQLEENDTLEKWLKSFSFEKDIVYLYPAINKSQNHSTIIFSNDKNLIGEFQFVSSNTIRKSYFDKGGMCCPPQ
jgi:hypothetical protein